MMRLRQILLIDDNDIDNYINRHILETNNVCDSIVTMISAIDALEYLNPIKDDPEKFPELIFLDIRMPLMDGFGFLDEFRNFPDGIKTSCIIYMLTSSQDGMDIQKAKTYPFVKEYLNKPLTHQLVEQIFNLPPGE
ncbi:MAG TPA: response regulator [Bacteroidia bacterium]|nr:response regulator [Bacteroidia bacterium]